MAYNLTVFYRTEDNKNICAGIKLEFEGKLHLSHDNRYHGYDNEIELVLSNTTMNDSAIKMLNDLENEKHFEGEEPIWKSIKLILEPKREEIHKHMLSYLVFDISEHKEIFDNIKFW